MKIEVLIPCHNSEAFIARALASVRAQTHLADLVTLHDDGSADGTVSTVLRLAKDWPRVRLVRSATNVGILESRKRLVAESHGDVVCFLDHDDVWPSGYLDAVAMMFGRAGVEACVAPATVVNERAREIYRASGAISTLRSNAREEAIKTIFLHYPIPTWSCVSVRRETALRLSELSEFPSGEEFALLALALERGDVEYLKGPSVERHMGTHNAVLNARAQHEAEIAIFRWFAGRYPFLWPYLPTKMSAIYGNSVYRFLHAGKVDDARRMRNALLRGIFHRKVFAALGAVMLGARVVRWVKPAR